MLWLIHLIWTVIILWS